MIKVQTYRKKPVVIEAVQLKNNGESIAQAAGFILGADVIEHALIDAIAKQGGILIPTLEGEMFASFGDYIIKGVKGEVYPCKPDIFDMTYEVVQDD